MLALLPAAGGSVVGASLLMPRVHVLAGASHTHARTRRPAMLTYEEKLRLVNAGLAVPGFEAEGRQVSRDISSRLGRDREASAGDSARHARRCTRDAPCDIDGDLVKRLALTPGPVLLLAAFAYSVGVRAFADEDSERNIDGEWTARLERRAERSRSRRVAALRELARQLEPVQDAFGWRLVAADGQPTANAFVFVAVAAVVQVALAFALTAPLRDAV